MLPRLVTSVPGPESRKLAKLLRRHESRNITFVSPGFPVFWEKAAGANVWDVDGNRFLDLTSSFGVATAGHTPRWAWQAFSRQAKLLYHGMGDVHPTAAKAQLCRELSRITFEKWGAGAAKVILGCSGSDAVEAALKTSFLATKKQGFIAFRGAYHGLSYGTLNIIGRMDFRNPFRQQLRDLAKLVPFPTSLEALPALEKEMRAQASGKEIGAILVEPVQGRGGEVFPPVGFLKMLRCVADDLGLLLIFDEIYTGFFRTGSFFACEREKVVPDLICLAKALASGYPISACVGRAKILDYWPESDGEALHTSTFLGNPLGCALALEALRLWQEKDIPARVLTAENHWRKALAPLENLKGVREVRGRGLLWGIELVDSKGCPDGCRAGQTVEASLAHGLILLSGSEGRNVISLSPPLVLTEKEISAAGKILHLILSRHAR